MATGPEDTTPPAEIGLVAAIGPAAPAPGQPQGQPTTGLVALANRATNLPAEWVRNLGVEGETCGQARSIPFDCAEAVDTDLPSRTDPFLYDPVRIIGADVCSTLSGGEGRQLERARAHLAATASAALAAVLWTGEASDGDTAEGAGRPHLQAHTVTQLAGGTAVHPAHAIALLDQALTACLTNRTGVVHLTPYAHARLAPTYLERETGGRWYTPNGHLVIADAGATGGAPRADAEDPLPAAPDLLATAPADQWAYGTGMVNVALEAPTSDADTGQTEIVYHRENTRVAIVDQAAAAWWTCCHYGVLIDLALPT